MKIISFAWTVDALLAGRKTVTRRFWKDSHAKKFKPSDLVAAYNKVPFHGGKQVAIIRITHSPYKEPLYMMTAEEEKAEGGLWGSAQAFIDAMGGPDKAPWVVRFELVSVSSVSPVVKMEKYEDPGPNEHSNRLKEIMNSSLREDPPTRKGAGLIIRPRIRSGESRN